MDIGKSFTYVFEDQNWIAKVAIAGGILLVGVLFSFLLGIPAIIASAILLGYTLTVTKNVAEGVANPLPEWSDFGGFLAKGFYAIVGAIIWFAPLIVLLCCFVLFTIVGGSAAGAAGNRGGDAIGGMLGIVLLCLQCLMALYGLIAGLTFYAPLTRFAMTNNQLSVFWDVRGNLDLITKNIGNYIIALLIVLVAGFIAQFGVIACVIGVFFTQAWAQLVAAHVFGQFWQKSQGMLMTPSAPMG
jgi:hypothetical protein